MSSPATRTGERLTGLMKNRPTAANSTRIASLIATIDRLAAPHHARAEGVDQRQREHGADGKRFQRATATALSVMKVAA